MKGDLTMKKTMLIVIIMSLFVLSSTALFAALDANRAQMTSRDLVASNRTFEWETQNTHFPNASTGVRYMDAVDANTAWCIGYDGSGSQASYRDVAVTTDGGTTWTAHVINGPSGSAEPAMINALSGTEAWAPVHSAGTASGLYHTTDGGATWTRAGDANMYTNGASFPNVVHFFDANNGFSQGDAVGGYYELYTTTDGGATWTRVPEANIPAPLTGEWGVVGYYDAYGDNIWYGTNKGRVFYSTDKGYTWNVSDTGLGAAVYVDVRFRNADHGIAQDKGANSTGDIVETFDGGVTWTAVSYTGNCFTNDFQYVPGTDNTWVTTGADVDNNLAGASYSHDGGHTWVDFDETFGEQFLATAWIDVTTGWAGGFTDTNNPNIGGMYKFTGDLTPPNPGTITGTVTLDGGNGNVEDVVVSAGGATANPAADGTYSLDVMPGSYTVTAALATYSTQAVPNVTVTAGNTTSGIDFTLAPAPQWPAPTALVADVEDFNSVNLEWQQPGGTGGVLAYHTGFEGNGIGTNSEVDFTCAARFTATELSAFYGNSLTAVKIVLASDSYSSVEVKVWEGGSFGNPGTEVYSADVTSAVVPGETLTHSLTSAVPLVAGNEYWMGYAVSATGDHPAATDAGPMVADKGAWMYFNGAWDLLPNLSATLDYNWCIDGIVGGADRSLTGYKVYRDGNVIETINDPATTSTTDTELDAGTYAYHVTATYDDGESDPSNVANVTITLPAPTGFNAVSQGPAQPNIMCTWTAPSDARDISAYRIYRDDVQVGQVTSLFFLDMNVDPGNYDYYVKAVYDGGFESAASNTVNVGHLDAGAPVVAATALLGNYPNPFNPTTEISFSLKQAADVQIDVFNIKGEKVKTLVNEHMTAAAHTVTWNGNDDEGNAVTSGVYFYKMQSGKYTSTKKMILMK
jgi:photosystem II stability/assembly factor-like uncharacterized protein